MAAVQAARLGKSVVIVAPERQLGGMSSSGLGFTDSGNTAAIGGAAFEFYQRIWRHYRDTNAWKWQARAAYGNQGQGTRAMDDQRQVMWIFEPHAARRVFDDFVREHKIPVRFDEWLDRTNGVKKTGNRITTITTLSGTTYTAKMFIDATYEGDLLAAAGVSYHVGREAQNIYGEHWAGVQTGVLHHRHHFGVLTNQISPYLVENDPTSGVLPGISAEPPGKFGSGDRKGAGLLLSPVFHR